MIKCIILLLFLSAFKMGNHLQQEHQKEEHQQKVVSSKPVQQRQTTITSPENEHGFLLKLDDETISWAIRKGPFIYAITGGDYLFPKKKRENLDRMHIPTNSLTIIHNEITLQNIMIDLSGDIPKSKIIDFGYARYFHQSSKSFLRDGLNLNYVASECFNNIYSPQSDIFAVGAIMYHVLFGMPPWHNEISQFRSARSNSEDNIIQERRKPLSFQKIAIPMIIQLMLIYKNHH